ncbi:MULTISPECIES: transposase [unclassified Nostoc]|uniref:transposase n=1 Tax=unclassified Nostoc TaxID=2593658 RepID=UPI000E07723D|nr:MULTISPECIES: transposase [unclassified Nostoc]MBD2510890.1 transposase [Desmonostoc muscorum FACHB-395]MBE8990556.1 transposase [Nostoc sp. LEGE 12450]QHG19253.1 transposase [Nostoc sp. ATCC 53789]RCJ17690.1 transposase [Nostoc sp. ATCC 53789]
MRKLTDSDKQEILKLYRETAETTSTLAERYGVSNSTISRLLKSTLPEDEYEYLVSLKRAARTPEGRAQVSYEQLPLLTQPEPEIEVPPIESPPLEVTKVEPQPRRVIRVEPEVYSEETAESLAASRRVRRRPSAAEKPKLRVTEKLETPEQKPPEIVSISIPPLKDKHPGAAVIAQMLGEDLLDESEDLDDLEDDDLEDDDFEEEDFDDDELDDERPLVTKRRPGEASVQVLPLSIANLPKTCYLVIDRSSELITRPLKDFGDLGQIPSLETQQRTLPVFDNHRVAKRFSTKRDRVIKVPDSKMLHKARTHLQAKGITRLLIDGQVYSLSTV